MEWIKLKDMPQYEINKNGVIRRVKSGKIISTNNVSGRYIMVGLCNNGIKITRTLHRLIATAFIPNTDNNPYINHIYGNKINNSISNLEWVTALENSKHAKINGLLKPSFWKGKFGKYANRSKPVLQLSLDGSLIKRWENAENTMKFGYNPSHIRECCYGRRFTHKKSKWIYEK